MISVHDVYEALAKSIEDTRPFLSFNDVFQLAISVILSAQTTDEQVNAVTPELFRRYPTPAKLARANIGDLEKIVHSTGFFRMKARNIKAAAQTIEGRFDGSVPGTLEELTEIPGIGRKSANVILGAWFRKPAIIVDTHFKRVVARLGLTEQTDPTKIELEMKKTVPESIQYEFSMLINRHGRKTCTARKPDCIGCIVELRCPWPQRGNDERADVN